MKLVNNNYYDEIKNESIKEKGFKLLFKKDNFSIEECFFNNKSFYFLIYITNMNYMLPFLINDFEKEKILKTKSLNNL